MKNAKLVVHNNLINKNLIHIMSICYNSNSTNYSWWQKTLFVANRFFEKNQDFKLSTLKERIHRDWNSKPSRISIISQLKADVAFIQP